MSVTYGMELLLSFINHLGGTRSEHPPDVLAFSVIIYLAVRSNVTKIPIPTIFKTIVQDATYYFLVIFTSQLVLVMFIAFASVSKSSSFIIFSTTHSCLYRVQSSFSLPREYQDAFPSFVH